MPGVVKNITKLLADDTKIIETIKNNLDLEIFQYDSVQLVEWANQWQMSFNAEKCKFMHFNNKRNPDLKPKLSMNVSQIDHSHL